MKKLLAALIASAFATVAFAQDKMTTDEKKKAEATKPYGNTPTENKAPAAPAKAPAAPAKDAAPVKKDATATAAPAAKKSTKDMTAEEKKAAKAQKKKARADKNLEDLKQDTKKP